MKSDNLFALPAVLSFPLAALLAVAALGGILLPDVYARETASWTAQGIGQDWVDLVLVAPLLVVGAVFSLRGSRLFHLLLCGAIVYAGYSLVLYAFAVHFNSLFLVYTAALGLAFYALVSAIVAFQRDDARSWFSDRAPRLAAGVYSMLLGVFFYALWLSEIVPALSAHAAPPSLDAAGLITNPVHILDIGIVLPAFVAGGIALVRRRPFGYWLVPVMLTFGVLMDVALMAMVVSMNARRVPGAGPPLPAFALMTAVTLAVLALLLRRLDGCRRQLP